MPDDIKQLEPPTSLRLNAAEGWIELGNLTEATAELQQVGDEFVSHPDVLIVRYRLCAGAQNWDDAWEIGRALIQAAPDREESWIVGAYAARRTRGGGLQLAYDTLLPAVEKHPQCAIVPFNLACYSSQLGRLEEARTWLDRAMQVGGRKAIRALAMEERDLEPLWAQLRGM